MPYPVYALLVLPYTRLELPGWGILYKFFGGHSTINDSRWKYAPTKIIKGKWHHYRMLLDLSDWSQRKTYFLGRYYELGIQQLLNIILKPGDRFVDIGANFGMISLHAANLVTAQGIVESIEPNPDCVLKLRKTIELNSIDHITVYPIGLSNTSTTLNLNFSSQYTGTATLCNLADKIKSLQVNVEVGDNILLKNLRPIDAIKIDVEGFEFNVLKGLVTVLGNFKPILIMELIEDQLILADTNSNQIGTFLENLGYTCYKISTKRKFFRHQLQLQQVTKNYRQIGKADVMWVHRSDTRLATAINMLG
jgi:FkbM family methyltransferase